MSYLQTARRVLASIRPATVDLPSWTELSAQPWGPGLDAAAPGLDQPADAWRWAVARWPHARWVEWRRRAGELEPRDATIEQIRTAQHRAYLEMTRAEAAR